MKALQITKPHEVQVITLERPEPGPNEVLIKVMASGICGTDIHILEGEYVGGYPVIPGHEFAGVVEQVEHDLRAAVARDVADDQRRRRRGDLDLLRGAQQAVHVDKAALAELTHRQPGYGIRQVAGFDHVILLFGEKSFIMSDFSRKLFSAVINLAESESTIFVGRGTHLILPRDRVLAVRLISSKAYRIQRVAAILGVSEGDARKELDAADKEQRRFFQKAFGKKDAPPDEFDLIINCDFLHQPTWAADVIHQAFVSKFHLD